MLSEAHRQQTHASTGLLFTLQLLQCRPMAGGDVNDGVQSATEAVWRGQRRQDNARSGGIVVLERTQGIEGIHTILHQGFLAVLQVVGELLAQRRREQRIYWTNVSVSERAMVGSGRKSLSLTYPVPPYAAVGEEEEESAE